MNRKTKTLVAFALCALASAAFAGQENKTPMGKDGKQGYGQQPQEQQQQQQDAKSQEDWAQQQQQQAEEQAQGQGEGNEQPE